MSTIFDKYDKFRAAQHELQVAQQQFETADPSDPDHIDMAIYRLCAAEKRVGVAIKELKGVRAV